MQQLQGAKRPRDSEQLLELVVEIPPDVQEHITCIIGPGGQTIRWISKESGVKLIQISNVGQTNAQGMRTCLIKGTTQESLQAAAKMVNSILYDETEREKFKSAQMQGRGGVAQPSARSFADSSVLDQQAQQMATAQAAQAALMPNLTMAPPQMDVNSVWLAMTQGFEAVMTNLNHLNERLTRLEASAMALQPSNQPSMVQPTLQPTLQPTVQQLGLQAALPAMMHPVLQQAALPDATTSMSNNGR